jgi:hypothetical protein
MFIDAEFMSAREKEMVLKQWKTFLRALKACDLSQTTGADYGYFPTELDRPFTDRLYKYLSLHCGFIAHYNRRGFLSARFSERENIRETIKQLERDPGYGGYRDLHQAMLTELQPIRGLLLQKPS